MKAIDTFRHPIYKHNCAQAIANKWIKLYPERQDIVTKYAPLIGGHAPGGLCGALYAAMEACPDKADLIYEDFRKIIGATTCRQIKAIGKTQCHVCVDTADKLLEAYSN